jgi:CRISPR-associated endonuclease/helicase Cas3
MERFYAHTPAVEGGPWHDLIEHLKRTAELAGKHGAKFEAANVAQLAGLWHDIGKFNPRFQGYLRDCERAKHVGKEAPPKGVPHAPYGARFARGAFPLLMQVIHGHHAGLNETQYVKARLEEPWLSEAYDEVLDLARKYLEGFGAPENPAALLTDSPRDAYEGEFFGRMIFSALVDADFLDTETHFEEENAARREVGATPADLWKVLKRNQAKQFARPLDRASEAPAARVARVRAEVYEACVDAASEPQGVFTLAVPTGGGKTRSGLAFALKHAKEHGLDRVIVAAPYTSIIEQTADVYRGIFKDLEDGIVLEHHSATRQEEPEERTAEPVEAEKLHERLIRARLASQNWDTPLVVTTTVQLFESLFANRTSKCRKLHNVVKSVVVLDEVQTLPVGLLRPILSVLRELVRRYHVSVVLCTATQPAFDEQSDYLNGFDPSEVHHIVPSEGVDEHFRTLKRVTYDVRDEEWGWEEVARQAEEAADSAGGALVILNSRKDALAVLDAIGDDDRPGLFHLSTLLCGAHRREVLAEVKRRLNAKEPCLLVSTQVVEAGVDLSFPVVFRAMGPLDRIVQAAGRCNREGELPDGGRVVVFRPREGRVPRGSYERAFDISGIMLREGVNLHDPNTFRRYFTALYRSGSIDERNVQGLRQKLDYPEIAHKSRLIDDDATPVVVEHDEAARRLVQRIRRAGVLRRGDHRRLQPYVVGLKKWEFEENEWLTDGLLKEEDGVKLWTGTYDPLRGVSAARIDPADLVG